MRRLLLAILLIAWVVHPSTAQAAGELEALIAAATGISRTVDASLQARAQVRAVEIQAVWSHGPLGPGEAEVIGTNSGFADPLGTVVAGWLASPQHAAILRDPGYSHIGCGVVVTDSRSFFVCLFKATVPTPAPGIAPPAVTLPNTAMEVP